jgi:transcription antitermination factor NusG
MFEWKVIYVSSRAEKKIAERIAVDGIEVYVPIKRELKQWSDRRKLVASPMITGYVFVRPSITQRDRVLSYKGVLNYVRHNGADAIVRENEIEVLRSIEKKGYHVSEVTENDIKVGDEARITAGPFKGFRGTVRKLSGATRYTITLDSIEFSMCLTVPAEVVAE